MQTETSFDQAASPRQIDSGEWQFSAGADWTQGRTMFGGLVAAAAANAMADRADPGKHLRTLQVNFAAPSAPGDTLIRTELDRSGKSTSFCAATITQNGELTARAQAVFASDRASSISVDSGTVELEASFDDAQALPYIENVTPEFTRKFDYRYAAGDFPYTGSARGVLGGFIRHNTEASGIAALVGLLDTWPPSILPMAAGPVFGSTVSLTAHIIEDIPDIADQWCTFRYDTISAGNGYATYLGKLAYKGRVIAWTEQLAAVFG